MSKSAITGKPADERDQYGMTSEDWKQLDAMTDDEVMAAALKDPDSQPLTDAQLARMRRLSIAQYVRERLGMSREAFAATYAIPLETLRAWERHEAEPTPAETAFLKAIGAAPDAVREALARELA